MSNYGISRNQPFATNRYEKTANQSSSAGGPPSPSSISGRFDSGISDVFVSGPLDSVCNRGFGQHGFTRPKFTFQGSQDDVENGDSGIMMGEDETFTDSARSHRSAPPMEIEMTTVSPPARSRSISPKLVSDDENAKQSGRVNLPIGKRKGPRLPKKIVTTSSVGSETTAPNPLKLNVRSASAQALSTETVSTMELSAAKSTPSLPDTVAAQEDNFARFLQEAHQNQCRVPPIATDFSMNMQNLQKYMDLFIPDKDGDT